MVYRIEIQIYNAQAMLEENERNEADDIELELETVPEEESDLESAEATSKDKIKQLQAKLKECEREKAAHLEELQRAKADFLNSKRRLEEERVADRARARAAHIEELLPLCDSFSLAMQDKDAWAEAPEKWRRGVEGIHAQLQSLLTQYKVATIDPTGETFDPNQHEAVGNEPVENTDQVDTVVRVMQPGYEMDTDGGKKLIRPARVIVGSEA